MDLEFKRAILPVMADYSKQKNVRRRTCSGANMRYENILIAADQDAD